MLSRYKSLYYPLFACSIITIGCSLPLNAALAVPEVFVSTFIPETAPKTILPERHNAPGAFEGVIAPSGLKKYDWQTELVFFSDTFGGLPAIAVSGRRGKDGFLAICNYSKLPRVDHEGSFLRSAGVPVGSVTQDTLIDGVSTASYTTDLIVAFRTTTALLDIFYYRRIYESEFARAGLLAGMPFAWHSYEVSATLSDDSPFEEKGRAAGLGAAAGVTVTFGSVSAPNNGLVGSLFLIYNKIWFGGSGGEVARHLQARLNGFRFGFSAGWRFNFY